jgi:uncharacterized membrane protein
MGLRWLGSNSHPPEQRRGRDGGLLTKMKQQHASALAIGMGAVAGLRPMTAYAVVALSLKRRWISRRISPFGRIISANASKTLVKIAMSECIADKLPFTPSRLKIAENHPPFTWRLFPGQELGRIATTLGFDALGCEQT